MCTKLFDEDFQIDDTCINILNKLQTHGYEAYLVGGCVRDFLMGKIPHDYDITTNAKPEEVMDIFDKTIPTGIKYGTVTVIEDDKSFEITTYRSDGVYKDGRRPCNVEFGNTIEEDLCRRDFTINAIAYDPIKKILIDPFGGTNDIGDKILKTVRNPYERFLEDALRIIRGYRFAVKYDFDVEKNTYESMREFLPMIKNVSSERINDELLKIFSFDLSAKDVVFLWNMLSEIFPVLKEMNGVEQENPHHRFTLDMHTIHSIGFVSTLQREGLLNESVDPAELRFALLFHDIGKLYTKTIDSNGVSHYYGHEKISAELMYDILKEKKMPNKIIDNIVYLIKNHQKPLPNDLKGFMKWFNKEGSDNVYKLLAMKFADNSSQAMPMNIDSMKRIIGLANEALQEPMAKFSLKDLAIDGYDVIELGFSGKMIGEILRECFDLVTNGEIENDLYEIKEYIKKHKKK